MKQVNKLKQLADLSFFETSAIAQITGLDGNTLYQNISRWMKRGELVQLKKGTYVTGDYLQTLDSQRYYLELLSNKLRSPSYLSLEYVLSLEGVLSEVVYAVTAVTQKAPCEFQNQIGSFIYRNISSKLFIGYQFEQKNEFLIARASKSKALFDYLYLKLFRQPKITQKMLEELRLNLDEFNSSEIKEFGKYCKLSGIKKYSLLPEMLF